MALGNGDRLGPYEILSPIGTGGMGEVYKARDTRLGRTVAIKVLPEHLAQNPQLRQRFEREARAVASLNHPHICMLHDIGSQEGTDYIVMESLEGETLSARIGRGALPLDQVQKFAIQAADALDRAHRSGVVHRDVKPANLMLTRDGVKVLDFGLAKKASKAPGPNDPTLSAPVTSAGTVLGTPQYMAPEQLEGKEADERSDIFAFGCVVYEMVTGKRAFSGETQASVIAAIMGAEPLSMSALQPVTPWLLERLVRRCLAKDPEDRLQSMRDVVLELRSIAEAPRAEAVPKAPISRHWLWVGTITVLVGLVGALAGRLSRPSEPVRSYRLSVNPPDKSVFLPAGLSSGGSAISPDGTMLAFVARTEGKMRLWVRRLDSLAARPLPGTEGAYYPFWSPDSRSIGIFTLNNLKKIEVAGGPPQTICDLALGRGGTWSADGVILFSAYSTGHALHRVSASGGTSVAVTTLDVSRGDSHYWPRFLPDSRHYLYSVDTGQAETTGIRVGALDAAPSRQDKLLLPASSKALYAGPSQSGRFGRSRGHLLYMRDRTLIAQPFDPARLALEGDPFPVAEQVTDFSVSATGILAYGFGGALLSQLVLRDRSGKQLELGIPSSVISPSFSPNGKRLAFARTDPASGNSDIWVTEVERGAPSRLTFHPDFDSIPVWSPDGNQIAFSSRAGGQLNLYRKASSGAGEPERITESGNQHLVTDWSRDGRFLLFTELGAKTAEDLMILPLTGERKPSAFLQTQFSETFGHFSPDSRWIAYSSNETGAMEIYVQPFAPGRRASGARKQISAGGGVQPRWRNDGRELFYLSPEGKVMAASVTADDAAFRPGMPATLFSTRIQPLPWAFWQYDVTNNGQRFILVEPVEETEGKPMTLVINWLASAPR